jgi:cyclopropane fatty-acyl-phospholipid synthase-like methyltransferase
MRWLERFGMQPGHAVLEIGCGIGTVSGLIGAVLGPEGSLVAIDISPKSVATARSRLAGLQNIEFKAGDVLSIELSGSFDVVVLPDVIEHIPLEHHRLLFSRVASWMAPRGFALLHYPNPLYMQWCHENRPELLQLVDQPIHADALTANLYPDGLYLDHLETYSIWISEGDYQVAVLRHQAAQTSFTHVQQPRSIVRRIREVIRRLIP